MRTVGTVSRGVRCPVIREGDNLVEITADSVIACSATENSPFRDKDIIAVTEAVVARAQGNYATTDAIAQDVKAKLGGETVGVVFPILSRNRFSICLKGIAKGSKKIVLQLSYPNDEVGNPLFDEDLLEDLDINPWKDVLTEEKYRELFGYGVHPFTGVDYVKYYREVIEETGCEAEIIFANTPKAILEYTQNVLLCDIHTQERSRRALKQVGAKNVYGLNDILCTSVNGSGYNSSYGLLGSNKATEDSVKLFPKDCDNFVSSLQKLMKEKTGKNIEVMIYGDGAFKDPSGKIWELADPVVSPAYTDGLKGTPNEIKLKYLADNQFSNLQGDELNVAIKDYIDKKGDDLVGEMAAQGTTPRQLTDLIGSLSDLTSGSGDKGTPIVWIQGYFDNFSM